MCIKPKIYVLNISKTTRKRKTYIRLICKNLNFSFGRQLRPPSIRMPYYIKVSSDFTYLLGLLCIQATQATCNVLILICK